MRLLSSDIVIPFRSWVKRSGHNGRKLKGIEDSIRTVGYLRIEEPAQTFPHPRRSRFVQLRNSVCRACF
jgi:hypothetical protein